MQRATVFSLAGAVLLAACAGGGGGGAAAEPPAPVAMDPVGVYSFTTTVEGTTVAGRVTINGEPGNYAGSIDPDPGSPIGSIEIYSVTVDGQEMTIVGDVGGEDIVMTLTFTGETYTGTWIVGFDSGTVTGSRIEQ